MKKITMYTTAVCAYCLKAKKILEGQGIPLSEIEEIRVDQDPAKMAEMMQKTERRTVPQIFIGEKHIGGADDLQVVIQKGDFPNLLAAA
jgi:glutaredoxin 3